MCEQPVNDKLSANGCVPPHHIQVFATKFAMVKTLEGVTVGMWIWVQF